ncbi:MAG: DUF3343 domain-containing protein [Clostridia bacterium]|nr:DUF3343 domain-containing protein [Clostridia bacterium]
MMLDTLLRREKIPARITPTPHDLQGLAGCGVAILIGEEEYPKARECIDRHEVPHHSIVPRGRNINPRRDRFC